jgi:DNA recombination protein RmuC
LKQLNQTLSEDAQNLAIALKGSAKTQGNWGEMILDRILEASGLQKGRDYELRPTYHYDDGRRGQPDVIINMPEARHVIIDSKVSLVDYDAYVSSHDDVEAQSAADRHVDSVRRHMKELAEKNYQDLYGLNSLDFVVMFVPIEPAFAAAIRLDSTLWENAFRKNVLIVSPSGLLFVLRTVAVLWRQESQARNVRDIAKKGADLYNKLVGFVEELDLVGLRLRQAQVSFDDARKRLCTGQGNVIRQAEMLKDLGVKPNKTLPADLIESAIETPTPVPPLVALAQQEDVDEIAAVAAGEQIDNEDVPF